MAKRDWTAVKAGYLAGATPAELAEQFAIPESTIASRASRDGWKKDRKEVASQVQAELPAAVAARLVDGASEAAAEGAAARVSEHARVWRSILAEAEELLRSKAPVVNPLDGKLVLDEHGVPVLARIVATPKDLSALAEAVKKASEGERLALGLKDPTKGGDDRGSAAGADKETAAALEELEGLEPAELERRYRAALG